MAARTLNCAGVRRIDVLQMPMRETITLNNTRFTPRMTYSDKRLWLSLSDVRESLGLRRTSDFPVQQYKIDLDHFRFLAGMRTSRVWVDLNGALLICEQYCTTKAGIKPAVRQEAWKVGKDLAAYLHRAWNVEILKAKKPKNRKKPEPIDPSIMVEIPLVELQKISNRMTEIEKLLGEIENAVQ